MPAADTVPKKSLRSFKRQVGLLLETQRQSRLKHGCKDFPNTQLKFTFSTHTNHTKKGKKILFKYIYTHTYISTLYTYTHTQNPGMYFRNTHSNRRCSFLLSISDHDFPQTVISEDLRWKIPGLWELCRVARV